MDLIKLRKPIRPNLIVGPHGRDGLSLRFQALNSLGLFKQLADFMITWFFKEITKIAKVWSKEFGWIGEDT